MTPPAAVCSTVLFDLDGTLIDSVALILSSYRHTLVTHRGAALPDYHWLAGLGTPLRAQLSQFASDPGEIEAMVATYRAHNLANHDRMVCAYPDIPETLNRLAPGRRFGLVTSKLREGALQGLRHCGLDRHFAVIVAADDTTHHKPHPEPVARAVELLQADPKCTVFVGDSPHDLAAGRTAGVRTAAALWGPFSREQLEPWEPDWWLESPTDLLGA